jgi:type I restriction enzyme S subunit
MSAAQEEWRILRIGVIASPRLGGNYKNGPAPSSRPLIKMGNIARVNMDLSRIDYVPHSEQVNEQHRLRRGDILFNTRNTLDLVGKVSIWRDELPRAYYNSNILRLEFRPEYCGDSQYFGYALNTKAAIEAIRALATGTTSVAAVYTRDLLKLEISVPPKLEQRAIVTALSDTDDLIATLEHLIAKKQVIKQGMMQQLLTGKTRLPGFTESWSTKSLGVLGTFLKGRGVKREDVRNVGIPCIRYGELYTTFTDYTSEARFYVEPEIAATALPLRSGDLLFAGSGETHEEIGKCVAYIGKTPAVVGGDIVVLRGSTFNPVYLALLANTPAVANQKARAGQGDAVVHINSRALAAVQIEMPLRAEQDAITSVVLDADKELRALLGRLQKARAVKQGVMQQLLTGRTHLPVQEVTS